MDFSNLLVRLLLLLFLPVIVAIIYIDGQSYDPGLLEFAPNSPTGSERYFPKSTTDFQLQPPLKHFTKDNLYEHVNGHADHFINAGFISLSLGEYKRKSKATESPDFIVEIYKMEKSIGAFGLLVEEGRGKVGRLAIGELGFQSKQNLSFYKGKNLVKITSFDDTVSLSDFSQHLLSGLQTDQTTPSFDSIFPKIGDKERFKYVQSGYRGLDFINGVMEQEYLIQGNSIQLSLFQTDTEGIKKSIGQYLDFFKENEIPFQLTEINGMKIYRISDPFEGNWYLLPKESQLFGIYGELDDKLIQRIIKQL